MPGEKAMERRFRYRQIHQVCCEIIWPEKDGVLKTLCKRDQTPERMERSVIQVSDILWDNGIEDVPFHPDRMGEGGGEGLLLTASDPPRVRSEYFTPGLF